MTEADSLSTEFNANRKCQLSISTGQVWHLHFAAQAGRHKSLQGQVHAVGYRIEIIYLHTLAQHGKAGARVIGQTAKQALTPHLTQRVAARDSKEI